MCLLNVCGLVLLLSSAAFSVLYLALWPPTSDRTTVTTGVTTEPTTKKDECSEQEKRNETSLTYLPIH